LERRLSVREAATSLGLSEGWVRRLIDQGRIQYARDDGRIRVAESEVRRFAEERRSRGTPSQMSVPPSVASFRSPAVIEPASVEAPEDWASERNVVTALATHLAATGWRIRRLADAASREHGVDLLVERDGRTRAIEVKGFPSPVYERVDHTGERKQWTHPAARSYMGDLLLEAALLPEAVPGAEVAVALPARATFVHLVERLRGYFARLEIGVYLVHEDGSVETVLEADTPHW
jgi:excisionase family DNA binding protein